MSIKIFNNFLEPLFIKEIKKFVYSNISKSKWKTNLSWGENIRKSSSIVSILNLKENKEIYQIINNKFNLLFYEKTNNKEMFINYYIWHNLSYIPFHHDKRYDLSSTIYLNEEWHKDYGGLFLYEEGSEMKAIVPEFNKCIVNTSKVLHGTSLTTMDSPYRETIQIFFENII